MKGFEMFKEESFIDKYSQLMSDIKDERLFINE